MGTGGSRYGAGRPGWRRRCELSFPLDIRRLHRKQLLSPGSNFGWHWTQDGELIGNISLAVREGQIQFWYSWTPYESERRRMVYDVALECTPCRFGGSRPWFRCLGCARRCAVLYGFSADGYFACRRCLRLAYMSEAEDTCGRLWRKQRKLEARLGENGERPKGMRRRTYEHICEKLAAVEEAKDMDFMLGATSLMLRLGMKPEDFFK